MLEIQSKISQNLNIIKVFAILGLARSMESSPPIKILYFKHQNPEANSE